MAADLARPAWRRSRTASTQRHAAAPRAGPRHAHRDDGRDALDGLVEMAARRRGEIRSSPALLAELRTIRAGSPARQRPRLHRVHRQPGRRGRPSSWRREPGELDGEVLAHGGRPERRPERCARREHDHRALRQEDDLVLGQHRRHRRGPEPPRALPPSHPPRAALQPQPAGAAQRTHRPVRPARRRRRSATSTSPAPSRSACSSDSSPSTNASARGSPSSRTPSAGSRRTRPDRAASRRPRRGGGLPFRPSSRGTASSTPWR